MSWLGPALRQSLRVCVLETVRGCKCLCCRGRQLISNQERCWLPLLGRCVRVHIRSNTDETSNPNRDLLIWIAAHSLFFLRHLDVFPLCSARKMFQRMLEEWFALLKTQLTE